MIAVVLHACAVAVGIVLAANMAVFVEYGWPYLRTRLPARDRETRSVSGLRRTAPGVRR